MKNAKKKKKLKVISLFSGALGLDLGLEKAGFEISIALENNPSAIATIQKNRPNLKLIKKDIRKVKAGEILKLANLKKEEVSLISAGPSCQTFSTAGARGSVTDPRGSLFKEFLRLVKAIQPRFFMMENVKGILSAAIKHRPLAERGSGFPKLEPDEELGSAIIYILKELRKTGYHIIFDVLNSADFGTPQARERVIFIGSRDGESIKMPIPTHDKNKANGLKKWVSLRTAIGNLNEKHPEFNKFPERVAKYMKLVPEGGNWRDLPPRRIRWAMGGALNSWGGRNGFFRRLSFDKPSPALTTQPLSKATLFCHPKKLRPLSVKEYARIQQFPDKWEFCGNTNQKYTQIGNAVPVGLGKAIGEAIISAVQMKKMAKHNGHIICCNKILLERMANRPITMLNPPWMRKIKKQSKAKEWLEGSPINRQRIFKYIKTEIE